MLPVIALVGRPNVGKSTLFNRLTETRDALVSDRPGITRDRQYGIGSVGKKPYIVIDTGGISSEKEGINLLMEQQVWSAVEQADHVFFILDGKEGLNAADQDIAEHLRRSGKQLTLCINKAENLDQTTLDGEFYHLGEAPVLISGEHGFGIRSLIDSAIESLPVVDDKSPDIDAGIKIAVIGRPNVGKSTLINRLIGEDRLIAFDVPGTTRDSIAIPYEADGQKFTLIDTAGIRRRGRVTEAVEKFSIIKTLQAIDQSNVSMLLIDAIEGVTDQDANLAGHLLESGCALLVVINKWDGLTKEHKDRVKDELKRKLYFLDFASWHYISALHGDGVKGLFKQVSSAYANAIRTYKTSRLTEILEDCIDEHQPPVVRGRRIKLRYAHQGGKNPPRIVIHGNQTNSISTAYKRYLIGRFRKALQLTGTPLVLEFKTSHNPYRHRKNTLTRAQAKHRKRLMNYVKKRR